jgi:hypothetical protein
MKEPASRLTPTPVPLISMLPASVRGLLLLAVAVALSACSQTPGQPYADAYRSALEQIEGTTTISDDMLERFVVFFTHESPQDGGSTAALIDPGDMYGEPMYFSDTLVTTGNRAVALEHLRRMRDATGALRVTIIDTQVDGQDAYIVWQMVAVFEPVSRAVTSNTVGVTHLRFDEQGRIVLHQDFWDSAEGFYRHLPLVGRMLNTIRGSFAADER